ncbi:MAG: fructose-1,6-bisphosphatase [Atopobiaceae bacterium]|jgi:fructose-1,6-bisphosphatase-3|nr:fructose-1,6-bisphosphatase [Atopobiaceae bacterium]
MSLQQPTQELSFQQRKYLDLLSHQFPTVQSAFTEIINLEAILNLPMGTEHFMSDLHGEYQAFIHILNNCSGVIKEQVGRIFKGELDEQSQADLCTLIYYPKEKLQLVKQRGEASASWYRETLMCLVRLARVLSGNYTRSKVRKAMPVAYAYIIDELLHASAEGEANRHAYHVRIIESILDTGSGDDFIESLAALIKRLAVDHIHIVGDIYDRGPHADRILDHLMGYHSLDIQWGNHDIVWMGAAAGSALCIAAVVRTNVRYHTLDILESAYGISLRRLALFAENTYTTYDNVTPLEKAISVILFKLEGQAALRHPDWHMTQDRLLLDKVDITHGIVPIGGKDRPLRTRDFPTLDPSCPWDLSEDERDIMEGLVHAFANSRRLHTHVSFLYEKGSIYLVHNGNLLFHGCIPLERDGSFSTVMCEGTPYSGRAYLDFCDRIARRAWQTGDQTSLDWMYYLWCGAHSPLSGRVVKTFERTFVEDESCWKEPEDPYYSLTNDPAVCAKILEEFGLDGHKGHIINGHIPVRTIDGESPIHAGGRLLVIDGGFCQAYHKKTGIAGYTLISSPRHLRIKAHRPFQSVAAALEDNCDIQSETDVLERYETRHVSDTDNGAEIRDQIADLRALLAAYRSGALPERS